MAALFNRLRCVIGQHSPSRRAVQYQGHLKTGPCKHCGTELEKRKDGRWIRRKARTTGGASRED